MEGPVKEAGDWPSLNRQMTIIDPLHKLQENEIFVDLTLQAVVSAQN